MSCYGMVAPWGSRLLSGLARTRAVASASASAGTSTEDSGSWELPSEGEGSTAAPYAMPVSGSMPPVRSTSWTTGRSTSWTTLPRQLLRHLCAAQGPKLVSALVQFEGTPIMSQETKPSGFHWDTKTLPRSLCQQGL